ncbi:MAG: hypothetical protein HY924_04020 [Elusimicrobia bacterium]|nr:hypothetical protein [Elusimicrobiota bacterium]
MRPRLAGALLAAALAAAPGPAVLASPAGEAPGAVDFISQARTLSELAACAPGGAISERFDAAAVLAHCRRMEALLAGFREGWLAQASAYLAPLRPPDLPSSVVYPFGGGDLVSALAVFPEAREFTLISLEPAGDPRAVDSVDSSGLKRSLALLERNVASQFRVGHSRTDDLAAASRDRLPAQLLFALTALEAHGFEPRALRYFEVLPDGGLAYLTSAASPRKDSFRNMELTFGRPGSSEHERVLRHIAADLGDGALRREPGLLRHLSAKGRVAVMTKAASYLLWEDSFSLLRGYLLKNLDWMLSDSTGIPPRHAKAAGFVQDAYGRFERPFLKGVPVEAAEDLAALWRSQPLRRLPFPFGYPDGKRRLHLLVTRRPGPGELVPADPLPSLGASYSDPGLGLSVSFSSPVFIREASPGTEGWFLRLQNFRLDEGRRSLSLDDASFSVEFLIAPKGSSLSYGKVRSEWGGDAPERVGGFPCRRFSGYQGSLQRLPFGPHTGILCPGSRRDLFILSSVLGGCRGSERSPACLEVERILASIRLDPGVFGR